MITGNWHFLFKFKSNSRNNRRDKCSCVGISAQDHCHSCHSGGAAHGHCAPQSPCLIFINISRLSGRPGLYKVSWLPAIVITQVWVLIQSDTVHKPPPAGRGDIHNSQHHYYGGHGWMSTSASILHWMRLERMPGVWVLSCIKGMNADTRDPGQHNFPIQYSLLVAIKFCGCRAVKTTSSLLSVTFVLSLEARLEDGLH